MQNLTYSMRRLALINDIEKTREKNQYIAIYTSFGVIFGHPSMIVDQSLRQATIQALSASQDSSELINDELVITLENAVIKPYSGGEMKVGLMNLFASQVIGFTPCIESF